jgi:bidirectional [NiFe] hydrogenase diaphorase subunit
MKIKINGKVVKAKKNESVLQLAQRTGYEIPNLCYHPSLKADGACRICLVELKSSNPNKDNKIVTSCTTTVSEGMEIFLDTPEVSKHRNMVLEMLIGLVPDSPVLTEMAEQYGLEKIRVAKGDEVCIKCGLCVRVCDEVVGAKALVMEGRGTETTFNPPFNEPPERCVACTSCAFICPVGCIPVVKTDDHITIWSKEFDRLKCKECGRPLDLTQEHLELIETRGKNLHSKDLEICSVCSRKEVLNVMTELVHGKVTHERIGR